MTPDRPVNPDRPVTRGRRHRAALAAVRLLAAVLPTPEGRDRYQEQWTADVDGATEVGLSPLGIALGAARTTVMLSTVNRKEPAMLPIGPLAIALRRFGGGHQRPTAVALTVGFGLLLLGGIVTLLAR